MLYHVYIKGHFELKNGKFLNIYSAPVFLKANCGVFKQQKNGVSVDPVTWDDVSKANEKNINDADIRKFISKHPHKYVFVPEEINEENASNYQLVMADGDSMKSKGINDCDMVWIKKRPETPYEIGDIVLIARKNNGNIEFKMRELLKNKGAGDWETCCGLNNDKNTHKEQYFLGKALLQ